MPNAKRKALKLMLSREARGKILAIIPKLNMPNDKRKTLKLMRSREARTKLFELTPKLNMPNDKRKTLKLMLFARSAKKHFGKSCRPCAKFPSFGQPKRLFAAHAQNIPALAWRSS